jgi:hypothetical protein
MQFSAPVQRRLGGSSRFLSVPYTSENTVNIACLVARVPFEVLGNDRDPTAIFSGAGKKLGIKWILFFQSGFKERVRGASWLKGLFLAELLR